MIAAQAFLVGIYYIILGKIKKIYIADYYNSLQLGGSNISKYVF